MSDKGINIISAGAPKLGVKKCSDAFYQQTGIPVHARFATTPEIDKIISTNLCNSDIVIAPSSTILKFERSGHVTKLSGVIFGSVKIAVMVKKGAMVPNISSKVTLERAILNSEKIIFNQASSGQYIKSMVKSMGIYGKISKKTLITTTGAEVIQYLDTSKSSNEIGFGQATEVQLKINEGLGIQFVGILPKEVEHISIYKTALLVSSANREEAYELLNFMSSEEAKSICFSTGLF